MAIENLITELQKKNKKFVWTEKCVEAFRRLKELLTKAPILKVSDMDADFLVCIDASKEGLGGVLMQDRRVIAYISRKLRRNEEKLHDARFGVISRCIFLEVLDTVPSRMKI